MEGNINAFKRTNTIITTSLNGWKKVAGKLNFPQHNSPCFVLFQKPVFLLKIKNIFLVFYLHLGSSLFQIWYPTISIFIPHSNPSNLFSNLKNTESRSVISTFKTWAISILKIWIEECQYDFYLKKIFYKLNFKRSLKIKKNFIWKF